MFMPKQPSEGFFKKRCYEKFHKIYMKTSEPKSLFLAFSCEFCENFKNTLFAEQYRRLPLIIAVSKGVLANENVNYDTKTNAYITI